MSSPYSQEPEDSTSDSSEPECQSSGNASSTPSAEPSSPIIGLESPAQKTSPGSTGSGYEWQGFDDYNYIVTGNLNHTLRREAPNLIFQFFDPSRTLMPDGSIMENWKEQTTANALTQSSGGGTKAPAIVEGVMPTEASRSISSAEASRSPAKTYQSQENERGLPVNARDCSSRPHESQTLFSGTEDGSSLRTYPDSFPAMEALTSGSYSRRWPSSGFTTSPGELWTADTSECPNGGGEYSSLPDVLEATVPDRFYLSQKAAAGILRRAAKRGRELPKQLESALTALATASPPKDSTEAKTERAGAVR